MGSIRDAALRVTSVLESLGIAYALGGSYASSVHGVARATQDLDIIAAISSAHVPRFVAALEHDCYVEAEMIRNALTEGRSFNVIDFATGFKIDIFPVNAHQLGLQQIRRRRLAESSVLGQPPATLPVISAEDTLLVKLRWYRDGGQASERQWNDVRNIAVVQGDRLDLEYLDEWSRELGVHDLLAALLAETKKGGVPDHHA